MLYEQPTDDAYRRLYLWLHKVVDHAIGRILDRLEASRFADDTIVVFTSDHGDLMGAHGGLQQKWHNAFDEAIRVPLLDRRARHRADATAACPSPPATSTCCRPCSGSPTSTATPPPTGWPSTTSRPSRSSGAT